MKYMRTDLHDQGFRPAFAEALRAGRSKASSASRPSLINLAFPNMEGFIFCVVNIVTQSPGGQGIFVCGESKEVKCRTFRFSLSR